MDALRRPEGDLCSRAFVVAGDRLPFVPRRLWKRRLEFRSHAIHARASARFRQHRETSAAGLAKIDAKALVRPGLERRGIRGFSILMNGAASFRIVRLQNSTLGDGIARAHVGRVRRITFELDRAAIDALDEQALCHAASLARGCEVNRMAGNAPRRSRRIGNDVGLGNPTTSRDAESGERERGPHHLHEVTAVFAFEQIGIRGKFTVHPGPKLFGVLKIVETTPIGAARRFHRLVIAAATGDLGTFLARVQR